MATCLYLCVSEWIAHTHSSLLTSSFPPFLVRRSSIRRAGLPRADIARIQFLFDKSVQFRKRFLVNGINIDFCTFSSFVVGRSLLLCNTNNAFHSMRASQVQYLKDITQLISIQTKNIRCKFGSYVKRWRCMSGIITTCSRKCIVVVFSGVNLKQRKRRETKISFINRTSRPCKSTGAEITEPHSTYILRESYDIDLQIVSKTLLPRDKNRIHRHCRSCNWSIPDVYLQHIRLPFCTFLRQVFV